MRRQRRRHLGQLWVGVDGPVDCCVTGLQGKHRITSGVLSLRATVIPHGSTASSTPITISFGGPFESLGSGRGTESDFTVAVAAGGQRLSLGLRTTATVGYLRLNGSWFRLPAKQFAQLRKSLAASGGSGLASLPGPVGQPIDVAEATRTACDATVDGTQTTEVRARVDVRALADELGTLLANGGGQPGPAPRRDCGEAHRCTATSAGLGA